MLWWVYFLQSSLSIRSFHSLWSLMSHDFHAPRLDPQPGWHLRRCKQYMCAILAQFNYHIVISKPADFSIIQCMYVTLCWINPIFWYFCHCNFWGLKIRNYYDPIRLIIRVSLTPLSIHRPSHPCLPPDLWYPEAGPTLWWSVVAHISGAERWDEEALFWGPQSCAIPSC